ncbi:Hsp20/alpha crystallin family protein [Lactobacillus sp. CBA3605]|uniref:Hsp20/alpha crystallin family protein n=1 Tax=Lactobacillus sp. CBA3605 TaxID=2099788 RepID=UPI000CFA9CBE|nr:Hsp20/alpha crystallin family protein [Lactobacillus sp. CBA3605]AVK60952.1 Hsp20/alpha crystallin family protein [Lactobacillus sp. CBA3605]
MHQQLRHHLNELQPINVLKRLHQAVHTVVTAPLVMKTDVVEHDDDYTVTVELPGFDKAAITVTYVDDWLTIRARQGTMRSQADDGRRLRQERPLKDLTRRFYFKNVLKDQIQAHYSDGLLMVTLTKKVTTPAGKITIQ